MSKSLSTAELREAYLSFFEARGCTRYPSAPLVNENDPTTLFTVAGMAQFKDMFLGRGDLPFSRATTCQKCMRTNDILEVGRTPRHHTFFEMLGNFSFNDYFKRDTINWAWEFLTEVMGLPADRLWVTTHHIDDDAWNIWADEVGVPTSRMERLGDGDNFWPADAPTDGPLGPGGCCSEIFWDYKPERGSACTPGTDEENRFVEIWNLVFPQFNVTEPRLDDGRYTLEDLGRQNIDTGAGLERLACVLQGKTNNFDIDLFQTIIGSVCSVTGASYTEGVMDGAVGETNALIRRIADHVRGVTFAIADKARPDNKGAGYIIRRLIRRATLDADKLGLKTAGLYQVVDSVVESMGEAYPDVAAIGDEAAGLLQREEDQFRHTLRRGMSLLQKQLDSHLEAKEAVFDGATAFRLYETDGFPREITEEILDEHGLTIDDAGWEAAKIKHETVSRSKTAQVFEASALLDAKNDLGATEFVGYSDLKAEARLTFLEAAGEQVSEAAADTEVRFALDRSPFYAESGGQVGDQGTVTAADGSWSIAVDDVQKDGGFWIHSGTVSTGTATIGAVTAAVSSDSRTATTWHHSATHLLHSALCKVVGPHVEQQGSKVEPETLRFDFNNDGAVADDALGQVETWVNEQIAASHAVVTEELPIDQAKERGAKALFGEKYGDVVRVVSMGGAEISVELCGGCHVANTGDIKAFRILREEASSAGVRRIVAVAGAVAEELTAAEERLAHACGEHVGLAAPDARSVRALARLLKATPEEAPERVRALALDEAGLRAELGAAAPSYDGDLVARVQTLQERIKQLRKQQQQAQGAKAAGAVLELLDGADQIDGIPLIAAELPVDGKGLRSALDTLKGSGRDYCAVLGSAAGGKAVLAVGVSDAGVAKGLKAGEIISRIAPMVGGKGGGKPQQAQGGGPDGAALPQALAAVKDIVVGMTGGSS